MTRFLRSRLLATALALFAFHFPSAAEQPAPRDDRATLVRARQAAFEKKFDSAVALYEELLRLQPGFWEARVGLAEALAWGGHYARAETLYQELASLRPDSLEMLRGLAHTAYWSGDFRRALPRFLHVVSIAPSDRESLDAISSLRALMRPVVSFALNVAHDDQPAESFGLSASASEGIDPLTTLSFELSGFQLDAPDAGGRSRWGGARARLAAGLPRWGVDLRAGVGGRRFQNGDTALLLELEAERTRGRWALTVRFARDTALDSAPSYLRHVVFESASLALRRQGEGVTGALEVRAIHFDDSNAGLASSAWVEVPFVSRHLVTLAGSAALSYRDSRDSRIRGEFKGSAPLPGGGYAYEFRNIFDPYVTPERQLEGRVGLHGGFHPSAALTIDLSAEAGIGRERATGFGPASGGTPAPSGFAGGTYARSYHPWKAALSAHWVSGDSTLSAGVSRWISAFYAVTNVSLTASRRF